MSDISVRVRLNHMKKPRYLFLVLMILILPVLVGAANLARVQLDSPGPGEVLQGKVPVIGMTDVIGFQYAEVLFSYDGDTSNTWFLIDQNSKPSQNGLIATWDTTTITDGRYRLRLAVILDDGSIEEDIIGGLQVRNYSEIEATEVIPTPLEEGMVVTPEVESVEILSTPTNLPDNPAQLTSEGVVSGLVRAIVYVVLGLILVGILFVVRALVKRD